MFGFGKKKETRFDPAVANALTHAAVSALPSMIQAHQQQAQRAGEAAAPRHVNAMPVEQAHALGVAGAQQYGYSSYDTPVTIERLRTLGDANTAKEARRVAMALASWFYEPDLWVDDQIKTAARAAGGNAEYMFRRFGAHYGWTSLEDAKAFLRAHRFTSNW